MASYSMTNGGASSYYGGGWGGDIAGFGHAAYSGMNNGMQFANNLYDLQRRVALEPYAQQAAIANYNANTKQDELSADNTGSRLWAENATRGITSGATINRLGGYDTQNPRTAAGTGGASVTPTTPVVSGQAVGVSSPIMSTQPNTFQAALMRNQAQPNMSFMQGQGGVFHAPQNMSYPVDPTYFQPTASTVETNAPARVAVTTQDPVPAAGAWSNGRWYG